MAGSFGFEEEKYQVSQQVGELELLPAIRQASPDTLIIANGFSCREQIAQSTDRHALHLAEVLQMALREGGQEPPTTIQDTYPEAPSVALRDREIRRSMQKAAGSLALAGAAISLLSYLYKRT